MFEKLDEVRQRLEEIDQSLSHPDAGSDPSSLGRLMKERSRLEPVVTEYSQILKTRETIQDLEELLREETDPEMASYLKEELRAARQEEEALSGELQLLLLPRDENDGKNVVLEIRAGVGGDEAARMWFWRSGQASAAMRQHSLQPTCAGCIFAIQSAGVGRQR